MVKINKLRKKPHTTNWNKTRGITEEYTLFYENIHFHKKTSTASSPLVLCHRADKDEIISTVKDKP